MAKEWQTRLNERRLRREERNDVLACRERHHLADVAKPVEIIGSVHVEPVVEDGDALLASLGVSRS